MNNKKTGRALDVVPCDLASTYLVISMSRRTTFVRTLVRQNSCSSKTLHVVIEFHRISDDDFRCRDLARALPARSPEAIIAEICAALCKLRRRTLFLPWWDYRAGTCAVPNPTKFFARSAGRGSLRHTPPPAPTVVGWCLHAVSN